MAKKCHGNDRKKAINEVEKYTMKGNKKEQKAQKGRGIFQEKKINTLNSKRLTPIN